MLPRRVAVAAAAAAGLLACCLAAHDDLVEPIGGRVVDENATAAAANGLVSRIPSEFTTDGSAGVLPVGEKTDLPDQSMFAYHKDFLPLDAMDYFTILFSALALIIAAGGGIGGGGILVPLYMIFLRFRPKHAIALSNFTILGGAIANTAFNVHRTGVRGNGLIDWDIIVMMEPSTIAGAFFGSFVSKYLPDFVLTVSLAAVLGALSYRTLDKGIKMFLKETEEESRRREELLTQQEPSEAGNSDDEASESRTLMGGEFQTVAEPTAPWLKILLLAVCFAGCVVMTIMKGSGHGSIVGVECGSASFWFLSVASIPWVVFFGALFRNMLIAEHNLKVEAGHKFEPSDIRWDSKTTITYPLVCTLAGVFAGLFGVGGGIVKGPLMLEMGVNPMVAAATAATMILFTTSAACVSFQVFGLLEPHYGIACFMLGVVCTAAGQGAINVWMKGAKRQSPPVLSIGLVLCLSTMLVVLEALERFSHQEMAVLLRPSSLCSRSD